MSTNTRELKKNLLYTMTLLLTDNSCLHCIRLAQNLLVSKFPASQHHQLPIQDSRKALVPWVSQVGQNLPGIGERVVDVDHCGGLVDVPPTNCQQTTLRSDAGRALQGKRGKLLPGVSGGFFIGARLRGSKESLQRSGQCGVRGGHFSTHPPKR